MTKKNKPSLIERAKAVEDRMREEGKTELSAPKVQGSAVDELLAGADLPTTKTVKIPADLHTRLKVLAESRGKRVGMLARAILEDWLDAYERRVTH